MNVTSIPHLSPLGHPTQAISISKFLLVSCILHFNLLTVMQVFNICQNLPTLDSISWIELSSSFFLISNEVLVKSDEFWKLTANFSCSAGTYLKSGPYLGLIMPTEIFLRTAIFFLKKKVQNMILQLCATLEIWGEQNQNR